MQIKYRKRERAAEPYELRENEIHRTMRTTKCKSKCKKKRKTLAEKKGRIILNVTVTKNFISFITQNFCQAADDVADVDKNYYYKFDLITLVTFVCCTTVWFAFVVCCRYYISVLGKRQRQE